MLFILRLIKPLLLQHYENYRSRSISAMDVPCHQSEMEVEWSFYSTYIQFMQFDIAIAMNSTRIFKNNLSGSKNIYIKKKVETLDFAIKISATESFFRRMLIKFYCKTFSK